MEITSISANNNKESQSASSKWPLGGLLWRDKCPVCDGTERIRLYDGLTDLVSHCAPGKWTFYQCKTCRSAYLDPCPTLETLGLAYKKYFTHETPVLQQYKNLSYFNKIKEGMKNDYLMTRLGVCLNPRFPLGRLAISLNPITRFRQELLFRHLIPPYKNARLLDIGCGNGAFVRDASIYGWDAEGVDLDSNAVAVAQRMGLKVFQGALPSMEFPAEQFDAVTMSHVIEHISDPIIALQEVHRILKRSGRIWIATPNLESGTHNFFKCHWRGLEPPRHLVLYNVSSLKQICRRGGFHDPILQRSPPAAAWYFRESLKILNNQDPANLKDGDTLPFLLYLCAIWADLKALINTNKVEELYIVATKR